MRACATKSNWPKRPIITAADFQAYPWDALSAEVTNSLFHLTYPSLSAGVHYLLTSSNLVDWSSITTNLTAASNAFEYFDPSIGSQSPRFYRVQSPR